LEPLRGTLKVREISSNLGRDAFKFYLSLPKETRKDFTVALEALKRQFYTEENEEVSTLSRAIERFAAGSCGTYLGLCQSN